MPEGSTSGLEGSTSGPEGSTSGPEGPTSMPKGPTSMPEGPTSMPEGSTSGPEGSTSGPEGPTSMPKGPTSGPEGSTSGPEGPTSGPEGSTNGPQGPSPSPTLRPEGSTSGPEGPSPSPTLRPEGPAPRQRWRQTWPPDGRRLLPLSPLSWLLLAVTPPLCLLLALTPTPTAALPGVTTTAVTATPVPCSHPSALEALTGTHVLSVTPIRSSLDCLSQCGSRGSCRAAAHVQQQAPGGASPGRCVLLGGAGGNASLAQWDTGHSGSCTFLIMNPCLNGGTFERGLCVCPAGLTGLKCQLTNPGECQAAWSELWALNASKQTLRGGPDAVDAAALPNLGSNLRMLISLKRTPQAPGPASSSLVVGGTMYKAGVYVQTRPSLRKPAWNRLDSNPVRQFHLVRGHRNMKVAAEDSDTVTTDFVPVTYFARLPRPATSPLFKFVDDNGMPVSGSMDALLQALTAGHSLLTANAVYFNTSERQVNPQIIEWELGLEMTYLVFATPLYYFDSKWDLGPTKRPNRIFRLNLVNDTYRVQLTYRNFSFELHGDPCWTPAFSDRLGRQPDSGHLTGAVLNGHRVRVIVDDLALEVEQVLVTGGDTVTVGAMSYLEPVTGHRFRYDSPLVRLLVRSDGTVRTCKRIRQAGVPFNATPPAYAAQRLQWFVDTRPRSRVLTTDTRGLALQGSLPALLAAVNAGAQVTVGLSFLRPPSRYLLLPAPSLEVTSDGHVAAHVFGLARDEEEGGGGDVVGAPVVEPCQLRAYLVTSEGDVSVLDYRHRESGSLSNLSDVIIDWFVDPFNETA